MRLLNTSTLELSPPYVPGRVPRYSILSHRWSSEEVTFVDIKEAPIWRLDSPTRLKKGFAKIEGACVLALRQGYNWIWIDSCCIDKSSSAELQEAINSMWRYYATADICYVYLADVADFNAGPCPMFARSEWFTRGWTLQELIAPLNVQFYAQNWNLLCSKHDRSKQIAEITHIDRSVILGLRSIYGISAAVKMSWAAHRKVTREEDQAYSLLGLFDINMPLLYGEGQAKAFMRLQEYVYNSSTDQSLFVSWPYLRFGIQPLLTSSPARFCDRSGCFICADEDIQRLVPGLQYSDIVPSYRAVHQVHESIMTTFTELRQDASTVLPLLAYEEVADHIKFLSPERPILDVTHVAMLNLTLQKFRRGAICILLRQTGPEAYHRTQGFPVVLPDLKPFENRFQKAKAIFQGGPNAEMRINRLVAAFKVIMNPLFTMNMWRAEGYHEESGAWVRQGNDEAFAISTSRSKPQSSRPDGLLVCHISSCQNHNVSFAIHLKCLYRSSWEISEVNELRGGQDPRVCLLDWGELHKGTLFELSDGNRLLVKLDRLPDGTRFPVKDAIAAERYFHLYIDYQPRDRT